MVNYSPLTYSTNWVAHPNSRSGFQPRKTLNTEKNQQIIEPSKFYQF